MGPCLTEGCALDAKTNGMCKNHAERRRLAELPFLACSLDGCDKDSRNGSKGMCGMHYGRSKRSGTPDDSALQRIRGGRTLNPCSAPNCEKIENISWAPHCAMHGSRLRRNGDTETLKHAGRILCREQIRNGPAAECIPYTGKLDARGYGQHRSVWRRLRGAIPAGMQVDHLCRFISCVNVEHMELVTPKENNRRRDLAYWYIRFNGVQTAEFWLDFWATESR